MKWTNSTFECVNGEKLAFSQGETVGPAVATLLMFPGFTSKRLNSTNTRLAELLSNVGVRCVAVDLSGHGDSSGSIEQQTPIKGATEIRDVIERLAPTLGSNSDRIGVIGNSFSGNAAILAAPGSGLTCLALKSPVPDYVEMRAHALGAKEMRKWKRQGFLDLPGGFRSNYSFVEDARKTNTFAALRKATFPVMAVFGGQDEEIPQKSRLMMARLLKKTGNECAIISGADHNLSDPYFETAMKLFADFLTRELVESS